MKVAVLVAALASASSASAFTIKFVNKCSQTVWPAVGQAPYGSPTNAYAFGAKLGPGGSTSFNVPDNAIGIRAWGRTGCNGSGGACATGNCNGGMVCTDAGITSGVIVSEYGYANFGAQYGGERTSWDLSHVGLNINLDTQLSSSDGQTVTCRGSNCPGDQAYNSATDYAADRNSPLGQTFTHTFCP